MNPLSSNNPLNATRGSRLRVEDTEFDVSYSEIAICDFSDWMNRELTALEGHFAEFITAKSAKRASGR